MVTDLLILGTNGQRQKYPILAIAAEQGNIHAQCDLGWMYSKGWGVEQNDVLAVHWYTKAAEQGNAIAQNNLGWMYYNGRGVEQSDAQAVYWYKKAAEQGNDNAQYYLNRMRQDGRAQSETIYTRECVGN